MDFDVQIFWEALTSSQFLHGALITVLLAVLAQITATAIGFVLALGRVGRNPAVRWASSGYVWFFRAMPALLVLLFIWNALPQLIPTFKEAWFTAFIAGYIGLSIAEGAYMAEILRASLLAVDPGQKLAGRALGMTPWQILRKVTLPQVIRVALPPTGNELVTLLKLTSLTSVISLRELLTIAGQRVSTSFHFAEIYAAAAIYYLVIVSILMIVQSRIERRYSWRTRPMRSATRRPRLRFREQRAL